MHNIIIYSTPHCPYCSYAKDFFAQRNISFEDVDVSKDRARALEMIQKSQQMGVPVIDINGSIIVGFQPDHFLSALSRNNYRA